MWSSARVKILSKKPKNCLIKINKLKEPSKCHQSCQKSNLTATRKGNQLNKQEEREREEGWRRT